MRDPHGQQRYTAVILVAATLLAFTGRAAADEADDAARPLLAAAKEAVADGRLTQSKVLGFNLGKVAFSESPEDGGVLIGFDLGLGKFLDIENIYALRAVYLTRSGEVTTKEHGLFHNKVQAKNKLVKTKVLRTVHLRASPGYAVGGVTLRSGLNINGLSVTFMRIHDRRLDTNHSYESNWVGDRTGGGEAYLGDDGAPVVGICGGQDAEKVSALGLYFIKEPDTDVAPVVVPPAVVAPAVVAPPPVVPLPAVRPPVEPPVRRPDDPPAAPPQAADPPPAPPQQAFAPATVPTTTAAPARAEQSSVPVFLAYVLPLAAFLAVAGLVLAFVLFSFNRKTQPGQGDAKRPVHPRRKKPAPVAPPRPYANDLVRHGRTSPSRRTTRFWSCGPVIMKPWTTCWS